MVIDNGAHDFEESPRNQVIRVRPSSDVQGISSQILTGIKTSNNGRVTMRAIGAGAVNQALKGAIQARQLVAANGEDLILRPGFTTVLGDDGADLTAVVLHCTLS